jgi:glycerol kinase
MDAAKRESEYSNWKRAVERTFDWLRPNQTT